MAAKPVQNVEFFVDASSRGTTAHGAPQFATVQAAVDAASALKHKAPSLAVIHLAPGVYKEKVTIPRSCGPLILRGSRDKETKISYGAFSGKPRLEGGEPFNTYTSCSVAVEAHDFTAEDVAFENCAGQHCGGSSGQNQAVAVRVTADRAAFYDCSFLGFQDTLYAHTGSAFFSHCRVEGSVDFIFGGPNIRAYFLSCHLHFRDRGWLTAHQRNLDKYPGDEGGFVFGSCTVSTSSVVKAGSVFLGRPWGPDARVVFHQCHLPQALSPAGWQKWNDNTDVSRPFFRECQCSGPGAAQTEGRHSARIIGKEATVEQVKKWVTLKTFFEPFQPFPSLSRP